MQPHLKRNMIYAVAFILATLILVGMVNFLIIARSGIPVPIPEIPRDPATIGKGTSLTYAILGDSTAVGQGGGYSVGIAVETAKYIALSGKRVTYQNFAVSGARVQDVLNEQVGQAAELKPDIILLSVGANDVTHLTNLRSVESDMITIVDVLRRANPNCKIIITGSPQMGSAPRFPQPSKFLAKTRTTQINRVFDKVSKQKDFVFAHIAERTGQTFAEHPELFAGDNFHPNNDGYAEWLPVLNEAIDTVL